MAEVKLKITCRIEEVAPIGHFLAGSLQTGLADFTAFSPDFNAAFVTALNTRLGTVEALINPKQLTGEMKVITLRMNNNMTALRPKVDFLEGYIKRATGLTMAAKDFGVSAVRTANNKGDVEKLIFDLKFLLTNVSIATNMTALTAKGYTAAQHTTLQNILKALGDDNTAQNAKLNDRNNNVVANYGVINDVWTIMTDVSDTGKRIYKTAAKNKVDDFAIAALIRRVRQEQKKNELKGVITSNGTALTGAKVVMAPVLGGRKRSGKSDSKGKYSVKSLVDGDYTVTVTADGKVTQNVSVNIKTGEATVMDFVMVGV